MMNLSISTSGPTSGPIDSAIKTIEIEWISRNLSVANAGVIWVSFECHLSVIWVSFDDNESDNYK